MSALKNRKLSGFPIRELIRRMKKKYICVCVLPWRYMQYPVKFFWYIFFTCLIENTESGFTQYIIKVDPTAFFYIKSCLTHSIITIWLPRIYSYIKNVWSQFPLELPTAPCSQILLAALSDHLRLKRFAFGLFWWGGFLNAEQVKKDGLKCE